MAKKIKLTESELIKLIEHEMENQTYDVDSYDIEDDEMLGPEEIIGLNQEQINQLQDRVDYSEELLADVLEFTSSLMGDLSKSEDLNLRRSKQKLRALETRAGREIFWLKSRRL